MSGAEFTRFTGTQVQILRQSTHARCTSSEFIDIMAGDWEEHATMLCNFFNHVFENQHPPLTEKEMRYSVYLL